MPSVINASPLIFSPFFCSLFFCPIVDLSQYEMVTSFSGLLGLLLAYLRLLEVFRAAPLLVRENIFARCLQRVLEYGLLYKGLFGCRRRITNLLTEDFKVSFIVVKQDSHLTTSLLLLQPSTPAMNLAIF